MSLSSWIIKVGTLYLVVTGGRIVHRMYIPHNCIDVCAGRGVGACNCDDVAVVVLHARQGRLLDLFEDCGGSLFDCLKKTVRSSRA